MTDQNVRSAFHQSILKFHHQCNNTFVIDELGIMNGVCRADIAVLNGRFIGYEIKTEKDSLVRLPSQVAAYSRVFSEAFLIVAEKHLENALRIIPEWWGVYVIKSSTNQSYFFECLRTAKLNSSQNTFSIAQFLWKDEALEVAKDIFNCNVKSKNTRQQIYDAISFECEATVMEGIVINYLKKRPTWRKDPQSLSRNDDCFLPSSIH